jgi:hypothetical protein
VRQGRDRQAEADRIEHGASFDNERQWKIDGRTDLSERETLFAIRVARRMAIIERSGFTRTAGQVLKAVYERLLLRDQQNWKQQR